MSLSIAAAQALMLPYAQPVGSERVALHQALGRVLAEDICAERDHPPTPVSAMDGFAVRSADVQGASVRLHIIADIRAGERTHCALRAGQCARIMTGASMPEGSDAVLRVEDSVPDADSPDYVRTRVAVAVGRDVRAQGESMRCGVRALSTGTVISPAALGVLAACKAPSPLVYALPQVAILSTGDELEALEASRDPLCIPDSNTYALLGHVQSLGLNPLCLGIARDTPEELRAALQRGLEADVLLVSGGSSVGEHDYVRPVLESLGVTLHFWRVAMRPGHPLAFGTATRTKADGQQQTSLVFGLPGNPVSSMVCVEQFALPALRQILGADRLFRRVITATLTEAIRPPGRRTELVRVSLQRDSTQTMWLATPTGSQSSGILGSLVKADGLLIVAANSEGIPAGQQVKVQLNERGLLQSSSDIE